MSSDDIPALLFGVLMGFLVGLFVGIPGPGALGKPCESNGKCFDGLVCVREQDPKQPYVCRMASEVRP